MMTWFVKELFHVDALDRALLGAVSASLAYVGVHDGADIVDQVEYFLITHVDAQPAARALVDVDDRSLVAWVSHPVHLLRCEARYITDK